MLTLPAALLNTDVSNNNVRKGQREGEQLGQGEWESNIDEGHMDIDYNKRISQGGTEFSYIDWVSLLLMQCRQTTVQSH